jgi:glycosyltransferase involved in cell wall biosynthesis
VILNAIDLAKFQLAENARDATRAGFGLGHDDFVIGIIGQLTPRKGQLELIAAFAQAELARATLLIVGAPLFNRDQEYGMRLEEEAKARGVASRVKMLGARSDVSAIMQSLDLLVVNSTAEPFGLVIVEAMACGTSVLAAAVDGIPEVIEHGVNGWLVPARDETTLTAAIMKLSRRPELRARLARAGRNHVAAHFSADRYMNDLEGFYQDLCEAGGHASPEVKPASLAVGNFGVR